MMQLIRILLFFLFFFTNCSVQKSSDQARKDDTPAIESGADTTAVTEMEDEVLSDESDANSEEYSEDPQDYTEEAEEYDEERDASREGIEDAIDQALNTTEDDRRQSSVYSLAATVNAFESGTDGAYYFDEDHSLTYCQVSWRMEEYTSGTYTYFFYSNELIAGYEQTSFNDYEETVYFHENLKPHYGYSNTEGAEDDTAVGLLGEADFITRKTDFQNHFESLILRLKEYRDNVIFEGDMAVIMIENVVSHNGEDFTETEEYRISREVFERLIKN